MRLKVSHFLALVVVAALSVGLLAGPASAKTSRLSAKQKAHIRAVLKKQVKKNPRIVQRKSFLKRASLVNFVLPVTIRLRGVGGQTFSTGANGNYPTYSGGNPNTANIDLGASLGQRQVALGGSLSGNIVFHDSYDGGALGNVDLQLLPSNTGKHTLTTTSIPLLWNDQVSTGRFDANDLGLPDQPPFGSAVPGYQASGCSDYRTGGNDVGTVNGRSGYNITSATAEFGATSYGFPTGLLTFARGYKPNTDANMTGGNQGLPGYPWYDSTTNALNNPAPDGYFAIRPGVDGIDNITTGGIPGNPNVIGPSPNPFPSTPGGGPAGTYNAMNTVLRTGPLALNIATSGQLVNQDGTSGDSAPGGSQNIVLGKSGGQANLFGNIPGKTYGIDLTANFATKINSIIRVVDQDSFHTGLIAGRNWPAGVFNCAQIWTGYVNNYIPSVHLTGSLKIAPGLTSDGRLRIAKATVSTPSVYGTPDVARFAVAACLSPQRNFKNDGSGSSLAIPNSTSGSLVGTTYFGYDNVQPLANSIAPAPQDTCNTTQSNLVKFSNYAGNLTGGVPLLTNSAVPADGYQTTGTGATVSVGADLNVQNVSVDVLIGDV